MWNGADKKNIQDKAVQTKQIYISTIHAMKHFKTLLWFYYCSWNNPVCVCVCVINTNTTKKGLNDKSVLCVLTTYFYCLFLSVVWRNFCFRGSKNSHWQSITRKRMFACSIHFHGGWLWKMNVKRRKSVLTLLVEIERVRVFSLEVTVERVCWSCRWKCEKRKSVGRWAYL